MSITMPSAKARLFYVDDSGTVDTGYVVYSWIETTLDDWRVGLRSWLDLRKELYTAYKIPPSAELHATLLYGGRGNASTVPAVNRNKNTGREIIERCLPVIGAATSLQVGTVYRQTGAKGRAYNAERGAVYDALVTSLDARLAAAAELGMIAMDGNGSDSGYYAAHRGLKLERRRIIEDPLFQQAHRSQWVQMADLVAWTTYQSLLRHPGKRPAWGWYEQYLRAADVNGAPRAM